MLSKDGVDARVIDMHTIKPLDKELVIKAAAETGKIFTVEEATVIGGLGSAVAETVSENQPVPVYRIGIYDVFGESGPWAELMKKYKLDTEGIYSQIKEKL